LGYPHPTSCKLQAAAAVSYLISVGIFRKQKHVFEKEMKNIGPGADYFFLSFSPILTCKKRV